ncbi:hypothetical protein PR003_g1160 [Phytophthora rubi]|uniref:Uncharacterized protein n=1 Tax=Phytophthora rubi TaxID=129364 RepID=A0A6A4G7J5_9STRA|nr:hypothetical protein PR003_g1160 [Phytophthora rubi]
MESTNDINAAIRIVQRCIKRCGYKRDKKVGSAYAMSTENGVKRDNYVASMASEEADQRRNVYLDESYIHHNYPRRDDSLYDPTDPTVVKAKHKER